MAIKRIIIKGTPLRDEGIASAAVTPGHLVDSLAAGVRVHAVAGGNWNGALAVEREMTGDGIAVAYAANDTILLAWPRRGDVFNGLLAANAVAVLQDDPLQAAGDGTVQKYQGPAQQGAEAPHIHVEALSAGVDIAERLEFRVPASLNGAVIKDVQLLAKAAGVGIDAANTTTVTMGKVGVGDIVVEVFDDVTTWPAANAIADMGAITNGVLATGDLISVTVLNGTTAAPSAFALQIEFEGGVVIGTAEEAIDNSAGGTAVRLKVRRA